PRGPANPGPMRPSQPPVKAADSGRRQSGRLFFLVRQRRIGIRRRCRSMAPGRRVVPLRESWQIALFQFANPGSIEKRSPIGTAPPAAIEVFAPFGERAVALFAELVEKLPRSFEPGVSRHGRIKNNPQP